MSSTSLEAPDARSIKLTSGPSARSSRSSFARPSPPLSSDGDGDDWDRTLEEVGLRSRDHWRVKDERSWLNSDVLPYALNFLMIVGASALEWVLTVFNRKIMMSEAIL